eukprot:13215024-Alexandrium_andersonii.AAC.1
MARSLGHNSPSMGCVIAARMGSGCRSHELEWDVGRWFFRWGLPPVFPCPPSTQEQETTLRGVDAW